MINIFRDIRTQGNCGLWQELGAARIMMIRHTGVAWHKRGVVRKNWIRAKVMQGTWRAWKHQEGKMSIKGPRRQMDTIFDEGKDINHKWHQSVEIRAAITSGKQRNVHGGPI
jgi:hypothetical protein